MKNQPAMGRRLLFAVFLLAEVFVAWRNYQDVSATENAASEPVAEWERRLAPLKKAMPFSQGVVGYISDSPNLGIDYDNPNAEIEYTLTQYVMAPIIVRKGSNYEWIIGNLSPQGYASWRQANPGSYTVKVLNYDIYLIHRQGQ